MLQKLTELILSMRDDPNAHREIKSLPKGFQEQTLGACSKTDCASSQEEQEDIAGYHAQASELYATLLALVL